MTRSTYALAVLCFPFLQIMCPPHAEANSKQVGKRSSRIHGQGSEHPAAGDSRQGRVVAYGIVGNLLFHYTMGAAYCPVDQFCVGGEYAFSPYNYEAFAVKAQYFTGSSFYLDLGLAYATSLPDVGNGVMSQSAQDFAGYCRNTDEDESSEASKATCIVDVTGKNSSANFVFGLGNQWFIGRNGFVFGIDWITISMPILSLTSFEAKAGQGATAEDVKAAQDRLDGEYNSGASSIRLLGVRLGWHF